MAKDNAKVTALISVCMLERVKTVASEPSATTTPSTRVEKTYPDFLPLATDPSVKTIPVVYNQGLDFSMR